MTVFVRYEELGAHRVAVATQARHRERPGWINVVFGRVFNRAVGVPGPAVADSGGVAALEHENSLCREAVAIGLIVEAVIGQGDERSDSLRRRRAIEGDVDIAAVGIF